jgi:DNA-binding NarL/FixJ family response regulator
MWLDPGSHIVFHRLMTSPKPTAIRVAIIEDDPGVRAGWMSILDSLAGYCCTGGFGSGEQALEELPQNPPDFVLMDINLPGISGVECTRLLKQHLPQVEVLMLTMFSDRDWIFDALRAGASGYLLKRTTPAALKAAMDQAWAGGAPMSPQIARQVVQFFQQTTPVERPASVSTETSDTLSPQETETLTLLTEGFQYKEIADRLGISLDTVRTYIRRIYKKLHVHSRTEAVVKHLGRENR